jgi:hypothetical protein
MSERPDTNAPPVPRARRRADAVMAEYIHAISQRHQSAEDEVDEVVSERPEAA